MNDVFVFGMDKNNVGNYSIPRSFLQHCSNLLKVCTNSNVNYSFQIDGDVEKHVSVLQ